jgi:hypothetical protein
MLQREESRHDFAFIAGVVVGAISGALATLALTPMSGAETREKIRSRASQTDLTPIRERATAVASSAQHLAATGREKASGLAAKAPEFAARSPLPFGQRHAEDAVAAEWPSDSAGTIRDRAERATHTAEPPEGGIDASLPGADKPAAAFKPLGSASEPK